MAEGKYSARKSKKGVISVSFLLFILLQIRLNGSQVFADVNSSGALAQSMRFVSAE